MMNLDQILADNCKMERFICDRLRSDRTRIVLASGRPPVGPAWVDLLTLFLCDDGDHELVIESNEPDAFGVREMYEYFRRQEMTGWEWEREIQGEINHWKVQDLAKENTVLRDRLNGLLAPGITDAQGVHLDHRAVADELSRIESKLDEKLDKITALLIQQKTIKEWYATAEVAEGLSRAEFTVREWCRLGHCKAEKKKPYRGGMKQWMIPHDELLRLESDGPAPLGTFNHRSSRN